MANGNTELTPSLEFNGGGNTPLFKKLKENGCDGLGRLPRKEDRSMAKMLFMGNPRGKRRDMRHRKRWHYNVQGDLAYVGGGVTLHSQYE